MMNYEQARTNMLKQQIRTWDVLDQRVLSLFESVPRDFFVPKKYRELAYADTEIPLWHGQTMMPPKEEARIIQALRIQPTDKILIIGGDSGFMVTLLAKLGGHVYYVDCELDSLAKVKRKVAALQFNNLTYTTGDVNQGWLENAPFDVILTTGSLPMIPEQLKNNLNPQGRLFVVFGESPVMEATLVLRESETKWSIQKLFETNRPRMLNVSEINQFEF